MSTSAQTMKKGSTLPATGLIAASVLTVAGLAAWVYQLVQGMEVTGLGQQVVWGLYIAGFFTAVGVGASLLALVGVSEFLPILPEKIHYHTLALGLASLVAAALLITMDVGNPIQLWRIITGFRLSSLMTWDFWLLVAAGVVTLIYLIALKQGKPSKWLGLLGILAAIAVVAAEGWMLSTLAARPMWGNGLTLVTFLLGAVVAGVGLALLAFPAAAPLRTILITLLSASLLLVTAEILTGLLSNQPRTADEMRLVLFGSPAPAFWLHLVAGLALPLVLLRSGSLRLAGGLAAFGVLVEKVWMLAAGQAEPWVALPAGSYIPSWIELVAVVGVVSLAWLVYMGVLRLSKER